MDLQIVMIDSLEMILPTTPEGHMTKDKRVHTKSATHQGVRHLPIRYCLALMSTGIRYPSEIPIRLLGFAQPVETAQSAG